MHIARLDARSQLGNTDLVFQVYLAQWTRPERFRPQDGFRRGYGGWNFDRVRGRWRRAIGQGPRAAELGRGKRVVYCWGYGLLWTFLHARAAY